MGFRPLHDRILVRRLEEEEKTAGGIIIPDTAKEKPSEGEIVAVGSGIRGEDGTITPLDVKAGDTVLFGKYGGTDVAVDGEDLIILRESDVLGIIETKAKARKKAAYFPALRRYSQYSYSAIGDINHGCQRNQI